MRHLAPALLGSVLLLVSASAASAQMPGVGPPFTAVEATWKNVWARILEGDVAGARRYVHSSRQHVLLAGHSLQRLQDIARQMAYCRVEPTSFPLTADEVVYLVRCEHGSEIAETQIALRRDRDGVWRLSVL